MNQFVIKDEKLCLDLRDASAKDLITFADILLSLKKELEASGLEVKFQKHVCAAFLEHKPAIRIF